MLHLLSLGARSRTNPFGLKAAVKFTTGEGLQGKTVTIQGVGHVGLRLARHLKNEGAKLIVADIFNEGLQTAKDELDALIVDPQEIHAVKADVFAHCAMGGRSMKKVCLK